MERLTEENNGKRKVLDHETTQTLTAQIELDKTAEDFRKAHQERQEIIQQWDQILKIQILYYDFLFICSY
jgi:UDP-glucose:O-linked fucose beta-1,3-glucosyltransferase